MKNHFVLDVETNGPIIATNSMIQFSFVNVEDHSINFYGELKPITDHINPDALNSIGLTHEEAMRYPDAKDTMEDFNKFIDSLNLDGRMICWSDNPAFDWSWVNWYMFTFLGENRLGWSCRRIGDLDAGMTGDLRSGRWKKYKRTPHTHNALDDATGNAQALQTLLKSI